MIEEKDKANADFRSLIVSEPVKLVTFEDSNADLNASKKEEYLKKLLDMNRMGRVTQEQSDWIKLHTFQRHFEDKVKGRDVVREADDVVTLHSGSRLVRKSAMSSRRDRFK